MTFPSSTLRTCLEVQLANRKKVMEWGQPSRQASKTDGQTGRQTNGQTCRQTDRQTDKHTDIQTDGWTDKQIGNR